MKILLSTILALVGQICLSQNQANIWYFGDFAGLDFNSGAPITLEDSAMATQEGCASIANAAGQLQLYTDGMTVWNRNHQIMQNGEGLGGSFSSTQSAIIVPRPGHSSLYYVFTVDFQAQVNGLQYSEVDMNLDGGLGGVTATKNVQLVTPVMEKLTATRHANGVDIWVITHKNGSAEFLAYLVTSEGVQDPVISEVGASYGGQGYSENAGYLKVSTDGSKVANVYSRSPNGLETFDFDNATGILSNALNIFYEVTSVAVPYGVEFSPSGDIIYVAGSGAVAQFDLTQPTPFDILFSIEVLANDVPNSDWGALQLGPDGKIYVTRGAHADTPAIHTLSVINEPDTLGSECDFELDSIDLGTGIARSGLPQFIQSFFQVGFSFSSQCAGSETQFEANSSQAYDSLLWDFGDGMTSTEEAPTHIYAAASTYAVSLSVTAGGQTSTDTKEVIIYEQPIAHAPDNLLQCDPDNDGIDTFDLTAQTPTILSGQDASFFEVTYYASAQDLMDDNAIAAPESFQNEVSFTAMEIFARVENVQNGDCSDTTSFTIQPFYSPSPAAAISALGVCDDQSFGTDSDGRVTFDLTVNQPQLLNGLPASAFTITYYQDEGLSSEIPAPSAYVNQNATETIYVQLQNVNNLNCMAITSFEIEVYALPVVNSSIELQQCDDDLDGVSFFNLEEVRAEINPNFLEEAISFHESEQEAINNLNPIENPITYQNQTPSVDAVWARVATIHDCYRVVPITLIVSTTQIPPTFTRTFYECDDAAGGSLYDGISTFDFSATNEEIEALFPAGQQLVITYYETVSDALAEQNGIPDISNYENTTPGTQEVYIRVDSLLDNDCLGLGLHITLIVEEVPQTTTVAIPPICDPDGDGLALFDTSAIEASLLQGQQDIAISYADAAGMALPSPLPNPLETGTQTIMATLVNTTSQDPDGRCSVVIPLVFEVFQAPQVFALADLQSCDVNNDGRANFDTSGIEAQLLQGQTGVVVYYTDEQGNALPSPLPNPFESTTQTIVARVENVLSAACYAETTIHFIASPQPIAYTVADDFRCDDVSNNGTTLFDLSVYNAQVLNGQSAQVFSVSYYDNETDAIASENALPQTYENSAADEMLFVRVENTLNPDCYATSSFRIGVHRLPVIGVVSDIEQCDDGNDVSEFFDLDVYRSPLLNGESNATLSFHRSLQEATTNSNAVNSPFESDDEVVTLFARLENTDHPQCFTTTSFELRIVEQPVLALFPEYILCENTSITIEANGDYDLYEWSEGGTGSTIEIDTPGTYSLTATNQYNTIDCSDTVSFIVVPSSPAVIEEVITTDFTDNQNTVQIEVSGIGDYEYSLGNGQWQDEAVFDNLGSGEYVVFIRDKNGCGTVLDSFYFLNYPKYFTPNNDGIHDMWRLIAAGREPEGNLQIFDRFGKLIIQLSSISEGWDGTLNGQPLPSSDYWFVFERANGSVYKGHFSLVR